MNELSKKLDINRSNLYLWREGKTKPSIANINKWADIIGLQLIWHNKDNIEIIKEDSKEISTSTYISQIEKELISLQREKILILEKRIKKLEQTEPRRTDEQKYCTFNLYTSIRFKRKINPNDPTSNFSQSKERIIEGDISCLGYDIKELTKMSAENFLKIYHPDSIKDGIKTMKILSEDSNSILSLSGIRLLKSKKGDWITFNCKMLWERDIEDSSNWLLSAYYTKINSSS